MNSAYNFNVYIKATFSCYLECPLYTGLTVVILRLLGESPATCNPIQIKHIFIQQTKDKSNQSKSCNFVDSASERQIWPDVAFMDRGKEHHSTTG